MKYEYSTCYSFSALLKKLSTFPTIKDKNCYVCLKRELELGAPGSPKSYFI